MKRNLSILGVMFLLTLNFAHALSFDVEVTPIVDKIVVDEVAEYDITITNNFATQETFTIKKTGYPFWDMYTKPNQNLWMWEVLWKAPNKKSKFPSLLG
jgi:hypothetical protein